MPFSENIKRKVKERAHYRCCVCHNQWATEVHHIIPESEGGRDTEENAAPLCSNCHDLLGGNPDKRKFIRENRDFWYNLCDKSSPPDPEMIREIHEHLHKEVVTKTDLDNAFKPLYSIMNRNLPPSEQLRVISDVTAAISTAAISDAITISDAVTVSGTHKCPKCGKILDLGETQCSKCGWGMEY
jgi:hypothetical protein